MRWPDRGDFIIGQEALVTLIDEQARCYCYHCRQELVDFGKDPEQFMVMPDHELLFFCRACRETHAPTYAALRALGKDAE